MLVLAVVLVAASINVIGIRIMGDVTAWNGWLQTHTGHFAAWRGLLYFTTAYGWWWMRSRVLRREPSSQTRTRLCRTEIAAVIAILLLETTTFLQT